jgi:hypothetical protein
VLLQPSTAPAAAVPRHTVPAAAAAPPAVRPAAPAPTAAAAARSSAAQAAGQRRRRRRQGPLRCCLKALQQLLLHRGVDWRHVARLQPR